MIVPAPQTATATAPQTATATAPAPLLVLAQGTASVTTPQTATTPLLVLARGPATATATAPRPPHPRATLRTARGAPSRASVARAGSQVKAHATLVTRPLRRQSRNPSGCDLPSDRHRAVSERQRGPARRSVVSSRGGVAAYERPGFRLCDDSPGDDQYRRELSQNPGGTERGRIETPGAFTSRCLQPIQLNSRLHRF